MSVELMQSQVLDELGRKYETDKCSGAGASHDYLRKYEFFFRPFRNLDFTFMELGIFKGASLKMWADYFLKARIVGVDCEAETLAHQGGRVEVILGDLAQTGFLGRLAAMSPKIIMDDASHWWSDQLRALLVLFPALAPGGIYVMEDIHSSFPPLDRHFTGGADIRPFEVLTKIAEYQTGNDRPSPVVKNELLRPINRDERLGVDIRGIADCCDAVVFIERACLLVKKI